METHFTPGWGLLGGLLIGFASAALLLAIGRIAGISGILAGSLFPPDGMRAWRVAFLAGLPLGAGLVAWLAPERAAFEITSSAGRLILGGLLVGFGTQQGSGCTSGHGVCGIARGSRRSLLATAAFMLAGAATVFLVRHVFGAAQ